VSRELQEALLGWYDANARPLPWRRVSDPYKMVVAEFMLQQTQVARVLSKYREWLAALPDWRTLAAASRAQVLQLWSGLGYNNRALRLHALARLVVDELGELPSNERELLQLPGIGPYTAGALMVFAHNLPGRCVDVNIERVLQRLFVALTAPPMGRARLSQLLLDSFPAGRARDWGNALMDLGVALCSASSPSCSQCPLQRWCCSKGERPEEEEQRRARRQSPFVHSTRWWRGRVIKLLAAGARTEQELAQCIAKEAGINDRPALALALEDLKREGIVSGDDVLAIRE